MPGPRDFLREQYLRLPESSSVMFVDETYSLDASPERAQFYVMSGVLVGKAHLEPLRDALDALAPSGYWHATEELAAKHHAQVEEFLSIVASHETIDVVIHQEQILAGDDTGEQARQACLAALFTYATAIHPARPIGLIVFESRPTRREDNADKAVHRGLAHAGQVDKTIPVHWAKTADEHLLWVADTTASAYRQLIARSQPKFWKIIEPAARLIKTKPMDSPLAASRDLAARLNAAREEARARASAATFRLTRAAGPAQEGVQRSASAPSLAQNGRARGIEEG